MKLHEALNLYSLHKNPEELAQYDTMQNALKQSGKWAYFFMDNDRMDIQSGNSSLGVVAEDFGPQDVESVGPFDAKLLEDYFNQEISFYKDDNPHKQALIQKKKQFFDLIPVVRPNALSIIYHEYDFILMCEHPPEVVKIHFGER